MNLLQSTLLLGLSALPVAGTAIAADFPLSVQADADSRWYDFYMDFFAQLDRGGPGAATMYEISAEPDPFSPTAYVEYGVDRNVFPGGATFADLGVVSYSGTGDGSFPVTGLTMDLASYVGDAVGALGARYLTEFSNVAGTVVVAGGAVSDITLTADVHFRYDATYIVPNWWPTFDGELSIQGGRLVILADDVVAFGHGALHHAWDIGGDIQGLGGDDVIFASGFEP